MKRFTLVLATGAIASVAACAPRASVPVSTAPPSVPVIVTEAEAPRRSIEKTDFSPDTWVYRNPTHSARDYAKVKLDPVAVYENMSSEVNKRDRRYLNEVGQTFSNRLERLMEKDHAVVDDPDLLTLRVCIRVTGLRPSTHLFTDRHELVKLGTKAVGTKLEADCYDGVTDELVFAVSTVYQGDEYAAYSNAALMKNIRTAYGEWTEHFKRQLDEAMAFN